MTDDSNSESRISRWSQRKIAVAREMAADDEAAAIEAAVGEEQSAAEVKLQAELQANREAAEAVNLESLNEESDFSIFMKAGVPELLKKRAMATLWRTSPVFANVDGLVDYDDDFASPDLIMKTFQSAYEVGKGYFFEEKIEEDEASEVEIATDGMDDEDLELEPERAQDAEIDGEIAFTEQERSQVAESDTSDEPVDIDRPIQKVSLRRRLELEQQSDRNEL